MDLYGDNRAYGVERVALSEYRWVDPASGEGEPFPRGTADLLQVVSVRKDGSERTAYAFRVGPADDGATGADACATAEVGEAVVDASDGAPADEQAEVAACGAAESMTGDSDAPCDEAVDAGESAVVEGEAAAADAPSAQGEGEDVACCASAQAVVCVGGEQAECEGCSDDACPDALPAEGDASAVKDAAAHDAVCPACADGAAGAETKAPCPTCGDGAEEEPVCSDAGDAGQSTLAALSASIDLINRMLEQAGELANHEFGYVGGIQVGVPVYGAGYTYVTIVARDAHGQPSAAPLHLHVETSDDPGCPDSLSTKIEYDREGQPQRLVMIEFGVDYSCRVNVTINEKSGKLSVQKVEEFLGRERRPHLLYKRGWTPKTESERPASAPGRGAGRRDDRGDRRGEGHGFDRRGDRGGRGWDDRRGGWDRDERGGRGGRWDERDGRRTGERSDWRDERSGGRGRGRDGRWDDRGWDERGGRGDWRAERDRRTDDHDRGGRWGSHSDRARRDEGVPRGDWRAERDAQRAGRDEGGRGPRGDWRSERDDHRGSRDGWGERDGRDDGGRSGWREERRGEGGSRGWDDRGGRGDWRAERDAQRGERGGRGDRGDRGGRGPRGGRGDDRPGRSDWRAERDAQRSRRDNDGPRGEF